MSTEKCDADVYEHGVSLGFFDMSKQEAEEHCASETKRTGRKHDWHYVGGRVHVMALEREFEEGLDSEGGSCD